MAAQDVRGCERQRTNAKHVRDTQEYESASIPSAVKPLGHSAERKDRRLRYSNHGPTVYKTVDLPTELSRRKRKGAFTTPTG